MTTASQVTTLDIKANGKDYILEWTHGSDGDGYIAITETCKDEGEEDCQHETYDFKEII